MSARVFRKFSAGVFLLLFDVFAQGVQVRVGNHNHVTAHIVANGLHTDGRGNGFVKNGLHAGVGFAARTGCF